MTEPTPDPDPKSAEVVPPAEATGLGWTKADARSFLVTMVGTVIGGMVLVIFLGIAVILAKHFQGEHPSEVFWIFIAAFPFLGLVMLWQSYFGWQSYFRSHRGKALRLVYAISAIGLAGFELLYVLIWVGVLAGVK
jgi:hypothetical protein